MPADLNAIGFFAPIAAFLLVFLVVYAVLSRSKLLGEDNKWLNLFISLFIASIFVSAAGVTRLVQTVVPWFAVLFISLFLVLMLTRFVGKDVAFMEKGAGIVAVVVLGIVFLVSSFVVFSDVLFNYLPGPGFGTGGNLETLYLLDYLYSPRVTGAVLLIILSALVSFVLVRGGGKKD